MCDSCKNYFHGISTKLTIYYYQSKRSTFLKQCVDVNVNNVAMKILQGVTLNNASDYRTNGLYRTPNPNLASPLAR